MIPSSAKDFKVTSVSFFLMNQLFSVCKMVTWDIVRMNTSTGLGSIVKTVLVPEIMCYY